MADARRTEHVFDADSMTLVIRVPIEAIVGMNDEGRRVVTSGGRIVGRLCGPYSLDLYPSDWSAQEPVRVVVSKETLEQVGKAWRRHHGL